jgi:anti-sigma-K factor RskA
MSDDARDLAAAGALGGLAPDDAARLEAAVARDPRVARELEAYRATVAALEAGVARERPPADLFDRILAELDAEVPALRSVPVAEAAVRRRRGLRLGLPRVALGLAAASAVAVVLAVALTGGDGRGSPDARAAVAGTESYPGVDGEARLYGTDASGGTLVLDLAGLPAPPPGHHYEVWVLRQGHGGAMEPVGSFSPGGDDASLELRLPGAGTFTAVDVSVEPDGGPAAHSGVSLAGGRFA